MARIKQGTIYKGRTGQWAFVLHRASGVAVLMFLLLHVVENSMLLLGEEFYDRFEAILDTAPMHLMEVGLLAALLFHSLNGLRVVLIDFWPRGARYHQQLFYSEMFLFVGMFVPSAWIMLNRFFKWV